MESNIIAIWWSVAVLLVAAELVTGTFYLLMLALGVAAGAIAAHAGLGFSGQLVAAALLGGGSVAAWYLKRQRDPGAVPASANRDVNLDIGERVHVEDWQPDGTARIQHRGAQWTARFNEPGQPEPGEHRIASVVGSELILER